MRYGVEFVSQIYFSESCLDGKEVFDKAKTYFVEKKVSSSNEKVCIEICI